MESPDKTDAQKYAERLEAEERFMREQPDTPEIIKQREERRKRIEEIVKKHLNQ